MTLNNPFYEIIDEEIRSAVENNGDILLSRDPALSVKRQTEEIQELIDSGVENVVCLQPFACLPNHVSGKGMIKPLRKYNPLTNIAAIDYDPGASNVNQLNRIKLMMATAHKNLEKQMVQSSQEG